jgi:hypothetical protein
MSKKQTREPNHKAIAEKIERLFSDDDALNEEQYNILTDILLEMSNDTGVTVFHSEVVRAFYTAASQRQGELGYRDELKEVLSMIEAGDKFEGYEMGDHMHFYRLRLRARELSQEATVSQYRRRKLQSALSDRLYKYELPKLVELAEASRKKGGAS